MSSEPTTAGATADHGAGLPLRALYDAVYLSPHLDDAILSCGAQIQARTAAGKAVLVVTIGAGDEPAGELSKLARTLHRAWRLDRPGRSGEAAEGVVARRRQEDLAACARVGADVLHWDLLECIYRRDRATGEPLYGGFDDLFGPIRPSDRPTILAVAERMAGLPEHRELVVPLGVGGHVDHRIARAAAEQRFGSDLLYYEEYPYSRSRKAVRRVVRGVGWTSEIVPASQEAVAAKIEAVAAYRSQIKPLFGGRRRLVWKLRRHHRAGGERLWWWEYAR